MKTGNDLKKSIGPLEIIHHNLPMKKLAAHAHAEHHLFIPLQGEIKVETKSGNFNFGPGKALFLPTNTQHTFSSVAAKGERLIINIDKKIKIIKNEPKLFRPTQFLKEILFTLLTNEDKKLCNKLATLFPEFLLQHLKQENFILKLDCQDPRLQKFLTLLAENPSDKIELLAKNAGLSSRTLARVVAQELATTPKALQQKIRLDKAIELLQSGESVTNVAFEIGYQSLGAFIDAFKHHTGKLPSDYLS